MFTYTVKLEALNDIRSIRIEFCKRPRLQMVKYDCTGGVCREGNSLGSQEWDCWSDDERGSGPRRAASGTLRLHFLSPAYIPESYTLKVNFTLQREDWNGDFCPLLPCRCSHAEGAGDELTFSTEVEARLKMHREIV